MANSIAFESEGHIFEVPVCPFTYVSRWPRQTTTVMVGLDGYAPHVPPEALPLSIHELGGSGSGNVAGSGGWAFEVRDTCGAIYRAGSRKACEKWIKARDKWFAAGRPFDLKSRYLDHVEGELVFGEDGHPYGINYHRDQKRLAA